ncbi:MAG: single-stranded DNA-binding protein, partial [Nitrosotalea sp.]
FIPISVFNGNGERAAKRFKKGDSVIVEGRLEQSSWVDEKQEKRSILRIVADHVHFCASAKPKEEAQASTPVAEVAK